MSTTPSHATLRRLLPFIGAIAAALAIASAPWALDRAWLNVVSKPLATLCVIAWAAGVDITFAGDTRTPLSVLNVQVPPLRSSPADGAGIAHAAK